MKTIGQISANVILTFEEGGQEFYDATAQYPNVPLDLGQKADVEADILEQILEASEEKIRFNQLVKISLCYRTSVDDDHNKRALVAFLVRNGAKFYFQPNQRGPVEEELMQRILGLAVDTKSFVPSYA